MSRSVFLSLKDNEFWGNATTSESSQESLVETAQDVVKTEKPDIGCDNGWKTAPGTQHPASATTEKKNPFQGDCPTNNAALRLGGFDKTSFFEKKTILKARATQKFKFHPDSGDVHDTDAPTLGQQNKEISPQALALNEQIKSAYKLMNQFKIREEIHCEKPCQALWKGWYEQIQPWPEIYSRKLFIGGIPVDMKEEDILEIFRPFGGLTVDWPYKSETMPRGYVFLIFEKEISVKEMIASCSIDKERIVFRVPHNGRLLIRPWRLCDTDYLVHPSVPVDSKRAFFIGGIPRSMRAVELAQMEKYGSVLAAGIDIDVDCKYPKGAGRVVFEHWSSYRQAIADRHTILSHGEMQKRVEMKPSVLHERSAVRSKRRFSVPTWTVSSTTVRDVGPGCTVVEPDGTNTSRW